jgi:mercuric ion binding protein
MKHTLALAGLAILALAGPAPAGQRTVTLAVSSMTCVSCPAIVKRSLAAGPGAGGVEVSMQAATAVVTFDDSKASVDALIRAAREAGYPSRLQAQGS